MRWLLFLSIGVFIGSLLMTISIFIRYYSGVLRIDQSNPTKDVYRFDVGKIEKLSKKKYILLKVDSKADLVSIEFDSRK